MNLRVIPFLKKIIGLVLMVFVLVTSACTYKLGMPSENTYSMYFVKSGYIKYEIEGAKNGMEELYFDKWGMRQKRFSSVKYANTSDTASIRSLTILKNKYWYYVDLNANKATQIPQMETEGTKADSNHYKLGENFVKTVKQDMGGKYIGKDLVWDKECDVWETSNPPGKIWIWRYIPLRMQYLEGQDETIMRAVEIDTKKRIRANMFQLPKNCIIEKIE